MKEINICWNIFKMEDSSKKFLESYLKRVKNYIQNNNLDEDLITDIESRIAERFFETNENMELSESDVIKTVNEIWEPEDIFADLDKNETNSWKKELERDSKNWMLLWVCQWLGNYFWKNPALFRFLFIIFTIFYWFWIWIYLWLALILNDKNKNEDIRNTLRWKLPWFVRNIFSFFWIMFKFFLLVTLFFMGIWVFFGGIGIVIWWAFFNSWIIMNGQDLFWYFPFYSKLWVIILGALTIAFWVLLVLYSLGKKAMTLLNFLGFVVTSIIIWALVLSSFISTFPKFSTIYTKKLNYSFENTYSGKTLDIDFRNLWWNRDFVFYIWDINPSSIVPIKVIKSDSGKIEAEIISTIRTDSEAQSEKIFTKMNPVKVEIKDNKIHFFKNELKDFNEVVPLCFPDREIILKIPENVKINTKLLNWDNYRLDWIQFSKKMNELWIVQRRDCEWQILQYSADKKWFYCNNEELIKQIEESNKIDNSYSQDEEKRRLKEVINDIIDNRNIEWYINENTRFNLISNDSILIETKDEDSETEIKIQLKIKKVDWKIVIESQEPVR